MPDCVVLVPAPDVPPNRPPDWGWEVVAVELPNNPPPDWGCDVAVELPNKPPPDCGCEVVAVELPNNPPPVVVLFCCCCPPRPENIFDPEDCCGVLPPPPNNPPGLDCVFPKRPPDVLVVPGVLVDDDWALDPPLFGTRFLSAFAQEFGHAKHALLEIQSMHNHLGAKMQFRETRRRQTEN